MTWPYKLIDLTHTLHDEIPTWNGKCGFHHEVHMDYSDCQGEDRFRVMKVRMHSSIGTHMDAPSHCIEGGRCVHDFDLNELCMPCVVINVSDRAHERYSLTPEDILSFETMHAPIPEGACVMVYTGWEKFWIQPQQYHNGHVFPSVSAQAAQLLIQRGAKALGVDTLSPDRPEDGFKVHQTFLGAGKIIFENVACLEQMPALGAFVMALPIKIKDGTEAPIRLVGVIESNQK